MQKFKVYLVFNLLKIFKIFTDLKNNDISLFQNFHKLIYINFKVRLISNLSVHSGHDYCKKY